ncbi:YolD-like family protein [Virgibacillus sp. W0430]|uniref:YolD-like family protein n=1 Tax=Virgibacillus sp. W0430 TaxID=3391580 RepID=UPI003F480BBA
MQDRGTKKWTALMLPEHVEMLQQAFAETSYQEKPILDEQQKAKINRELTEALRANSSVKVTMHRTHYLEKICGRLLQVDKRNACLQLYSDRKEEIPLSSVIDVEII